ncbi:MAG TPA: hypothetical protein PK777_03640 [Thermoguttaceae bacterium]|nr:hypothetical protein [Thermoguttaceae bacterium]HPP52020.1 hypothetical protein [Thermoguttaceae bacterium]
MDGKQSVGLWGVVGVCGGLLLAVSAGCMGALTTAAYLLRGTDVPAEFNGLKGKKVVVVCQPMVAMQVRNSTAARDLARQISTLLQQNVSKIQVVSSQKVENWMDQNSWDEYIDIGKALQADIVVGVDLEEFNLYQSQTLYQGKASLTVKVIDCAAGGKVVFERALPQIRYPPNHSIPAWEKPEAQFRREFIAHLAECVGRYFYGYDPYRDFAQDAAVMH